MKTLIRVNMIDTFSKCTHSIEKKVNNTDLAKLEHAMINGIICNRYENNINFHWKIEEIEYL